MMNLFKNTKISTKLVASFAILILALSFVGGYAMISINSLVAADKRIYEENLQGIATLGDLSRSYYQLRVQVLKTVHEDFTAQGADKLNAEILAAGDKFTGFLDEYQQSQANNAESQAEIASLRADVSTYMTEVSAFVPLIRSGERDAVLQKLADAASIAGSVATKIGQLQDSDVARSGKTHESNAALGSSTTLTIVIVGVAVLLLAVLVAVLVTRSITGPINKIVASANKLAKGDMNTNLDIDSKDEMGVLARSFAEVAGAVSLLIEDINGLVEAAKNGQLSTRADSARHNGEYKRIIEGFNNSLEAIVTPLKEATGILEMMSVNDLSQTLTGSYKGDMKVLTDAINDIHGRLMSIQQAFISIAAGDMSMQAEFERVGKRSERDNIVPAVIRTMHTLNNLTADANRLSAAAAGGNLDVRGEAEKYEGKYRQLIEGINNIIDAMAEPMREAVGVLGTMAQNDFTADMTGSYKGSFEELATSVNSLNETMNQMLSDISTAAEQVASGTTQVAAGSQALSQGATEQASATEELTASVMEIANQTRQNAENASEASRLSVAARSDATEGDSRMNELQRAMADINEASANISKIIKVIDDIAFQTNLLALNAAVEAARAGQYGKGFAVVAEEVRNLAQRSAGAAKETTQMIEESIKKVKDGTRIANETAQALKRIVTGVEKATELVGGIAEASNSQAMAVAQVNSGIEQVAQVTQTNSATAEESAAASEELSGQASLLKDMVGRFTLRGQMAGGHRAALSGRPAPKLQTPAKPAAGKPMIALNDREFGKY